MPATYTTVIVTRNRPEALALSLPLHLAQSRLPEAVLVIDSSDDPGPNRDLVTALAGTSRLPVTHLVSPPGMTVQRNIGLALVDTEVVFFPDDDSLVHPGALEAMMRIYDRDTDRIIGGVCSAEAQMPPPGVLDGAGYQMAAPYRKTRADKLRSRLATVRSRLERRFLKNPTDLHMQRRHAALPPAPAWLAEENARTVPWMTGFRMSFRTAAIRQRGFDEHLGRYALSEDLDASFSVLRTHLLVAARKAQIYHHKMPGRRANGHALGAMQILNNAYVFARTGMHDPDMRAAVLQSLNYKTFLYRIAAKDSFTRERYLGARAALALAPSLFDAPPETVTDHYLRLRNTCFESEN